MAASADLQGESRDDLDVTVYHGQPAADTDAGPVAFDALDPAAVAQAVDAGDSIAIAGSVNGGYNEGDQVTVNVHGVDYQGAVDDQGHFSIDVPGSDLIADADATLEGLLVTTDADGNPQTQGFTQSLGELASDTVTGDPATAASSEPVPFADPGADQVSGADLQADASADHLSPYLDMVGVADGGNGGHVGLSASADSPYLDSVGVTPETAQAGTGAETAVDDDASVAAADPFDEPAPSQADDPLQAIEGMPDDLPTMEPPPVADVDFDHQQHG